MNTLIPKLKVFFPSSSSSSSGLNSSKNKHQPMQVVCVSQNDREEKRIKHQLGTLQTKSHKETRKGNGDVAVKIIKDTMTGLGVILTDAEAKRMAGLNSGDFGKEGYKRYLEAKEKVTPKSPPKAVVGRSKKRNRKQKIPPPKEAKKKDAGGRGWWRRRRWNAGGGGAGKTVWSEDTKVKSVVNVNIAMPEAEEKEVSVKKAGSGGDAGEGGEGREGDERGGDDGQRGGGGGGRA